MTEGEFSDVPPELRRMLEGLDPEQRDVLYARFGLERGAPRTLEEVAEMFATTRERIREIEQRAMEKLRRDLGQQDD